MFLTFKRHNCTLLLQGSCRIADRWHGGAQTAFQEGQGGHLFSSLLRLPILKLRRLSSRAPTDAVALAKKHDVSSRRVWHACAFDGLCVDMLELLLTSADLQAPSQERLRHRRPGIGALPSPRHAEVGILPPRSGFRLRYFAEKPAPKVRQRCCPRSIADRVFFHHSHALPSILAWAQDCPGVSQKTLEAQCCTALRPQTRRPDCAENSVSASVCTDALPDSRIARKTPSASCCVAVR